MKMCMNHWDKIKAAIKSHGVWDLVANSGQEAVTQMKEELEGVKKTRKNYDPLMAAHNMIWGRALELGGMYLMGANPNDPEGHFCPLCEVAKNIGPEVADNWIAGASKAAADYVKELPSGDEPDPTANLEPYQKRVVAEKAELDVKREKLMAFLRSDACKLISDPEQNRLSRQLLAMTAYSDILGERITAFTAIHKSDCSVHNEPASPAGGCDCGAEHA